MDHYHKFWNSTCRIVSQRKSLSYGEKCLACHILITVPHKNAKFNAENITHQLLSSYKTHLANLAFYSYRKPQCA